MYVNALISYKRGGGKTCVGRTITYKHKKVADIYPEYYLINVNNFNDIAKDTLDEWICFLKNETLDILKMDEGERADYERYCDQLRYVSLRHWDGVKIAK